MSGTERYFRQLVSDAKGGAARAICSVCSSNRLVIEAAMEESMGTDSPVLIEATANQTNQYGGYTGMTPADFKAYVYGLAEKLGFDTDRLILGGDHLGPLVWSGEPEASAMEKAEELVRQFARAGFGKIHLDCSMRLGDDDPLAPLPAEKVARRAARLAAVAEAAAAERPVYVIGSEVPIPGGATEAEASVAVTRPEALTEEYETFRRCFGELGLQDAWDRVIAIVVQPGVEFGDDQVFRYDRAAAAELVSTAKELPGVVLEGHSTDYQPARCLRQMREDGIGVLKVGPALTFAAREALFALESIERALYPAAPADGWSDLARTLEEAMLRAPANWQKHYHGDEQTLRLMRRFSLSDRCRYYLDDPAVQEAIETLFRNIDAAQIPLGLLSQYMPRQAAAVIEGSLPLEAEALVKENIRYVLRTYGENGEN